MRKGLEIEDKIIRLHPYWDKSSHEWAKRAHSCCRVTSPLPLRPGQKCFKYRIAGWHSIRIFLILQSLVTIDSHVILLSHSSLWSVDTILITTCYSMRRPSVASMNNRGIMTTPHGQPSHLPTSSFCDITTSRAIKITFLLMTFTFISNAQYSVSAGYTTLWGEDDTENPVVMHEWESYDQSISYDFDFQRTRSFEPTYRIAFGYHITLGRHFSLRPQIIYSKNTESKILRSPIECKIRYAF